MNTQEKIIKKKPLKWAFQPPKNPVRPIRTDRTPTFKTGWRKGVTVFLFTAKRYFILITIKTKGGDSIAGQTKAAKNIQRNAFQLTVNNPSCHGYSHHDIKDKLVSYFSTLKYFCMSDEIGEKGTPHTHVYVCFSSRVRFSSLKKHFPEAHIEPAYADVQSNIDYIRKAGKWADTSKAETRVEGSFEEWGTVPVQKGRCQDMQELYELIQAGYSNAEILALNNDYIMMIDKLDKVRTMLLTEKYKGTRRLGMKVIYISGTTGAGKTRGVLDEHGDANVYRVSDYRHPFDSYNCQEVLVFDEFRSQLPISDMLNYLDIYPLELPARYANKYACYETVYILTNWKLEDQYKEVQLNDMESWAAFLRRIHEVRVYSEDKAVTVYSPVEKYMNRHTSFQPAPAEGIPFRENPVPYTQEEIPACRDRHSKGYKRLAIK